MGVKKASQLIAVTDHPSAAKPTSLRTKIISDLYVEVADYYICKGTEPFMVRVHLELDGQIVHICEQ